MKARLSLLPIRDQRGSRARCLLLTDGGRELVANRLNQIAKPFAAVDPRRHNWMPNGPEKSAEARLGEVSGFLSDVDREAVSAWWLAVRKVPNGIVNTPNWDIAATATIGGQEGLLLVEAKAHDAELKTNGKGPGNPLNDERIGAAIEEASESLNRLQPGWHLSRDSHYQFANRFAWAWKIASLGVPVVLVYLGFLKADEMRDHGVPFADKKTWERLIRAHARGLAPENVWENPLSVKGTAMVALIRSLSVPLEG
jgi:hypothetical protein